MTDPYEYRRRQSPRQNPPYHRPPRQGPPRPHEPRHNPPRQPRQSPPRRGKGISPGKVLAFGFLGLLLGEAVKWWEDSFSPLLVSASTIAIAMIPLLVDYARSSAPAEEEYYPRAPRGYRPPPPRRRVGSLLVGILLLITVGGGAAYGISWAFGRITGNETVITDRLVAPVTGAADSLSMSVDAVEITDHFTKVRVTARNDDTMTVKINVWASAQLVDGAGQSLEPAKVITAPSDIDVPSNGIPVTEVITFSGRPTPDATTVTLTFSFLFAMDFDFKADSLQVGGIQLEPFIE